MARNLDFDICRWDLVTAALEALTAEFLVEAMDLPAVIVAMVIPVASVRVIPSAVGLIPVTPAAIMMPPVALDRYLPRCRFLGHRARGERAAPEHHGHDGGEQPESWASHV